MNTYLHSKPSFTSPQPLAAASGLTIPLSLTLSDIKLSAFIIVVFSRQKGLTIVFRNDPLESLKVSSTFDSIQFVRDYLQKTIEGKLRDLMMDELPAIIHRLSLSLWCPDQMPREEEEAPTSSEPAVDPFASPPQDAVDAHGNLLDPSEISSLSLDGGPELQTLFSQKNLTRLASLNDCNRTMSLFTPSLRDVVFRAWAGSQEKSDYASPPLATPSLTKAHSFQANSTTYTFSDTSSLDQGYMPSSRSSMINLNSAATGLSLGSGRNSRSNAGRKKKTRVVNLRRRNTDSTVASASTSETSDTATETASVDAPLSESLMNTTISEEPEDHAPLSPTKVRFDHHAAALDSHPTRPPLKQELYNAEVSHVSTHEKNSLHSTHKNPAIQVQASEKAPITADAKAGLEFSPLKGPPSESSSAIFEQVWIQKMAGEIARRVYDEKRRNPGFWEDREDGPPPAYEAQ